MPININHAKNKLTTDSNTLNIEAQVKNAIDPVDPQDLTTKAYVDSISGSGGNLTLGTPVDGTFGDGSLKTLDPTQTITDAIDDLNETIENIRNNTFVRDVDFTADVDTGGAGLAVTLTTAVDGNANSFSINWGDGTTESTVDTTPTHVYNTNVGSPFDVSVTALNTGGSGTGSSAIETKTDFITIYTATPVVSFAAYSAPTGGIPLVQWDEGDTVYFENTTTNTSGATVQYNWTWGDGTNSVIVNSDNDDGGVTGNRLAHTFGEVSEEGSGVISAYKLMSIVNDTDALTLTWTFDSEAGAENFKLLVDGMSIVTGQAGSPNIFWDDNGDYYRFGPNLSSWDARTYIATRVGTAVTITISDGVTALASLGTVPSGGATLTELSTTNISAPTKGSNANRYTVGETVNSYWGSSSVVFGADSGGSAVSSETDVQRLVTLTLASHSTATPAEIPTSDNDTYEVYSSHTPEISLNLTSGINEESSSGLTITATNNTESTIGSYATFGTQYLYTWGDGTTDTVNVGSGANGDTAGTITHKYTLTNSEQSNGTSRDYTGTLKVLSNHSSSPFTSSTFTVHVEPDVRASISATALYPSNKTGDNIYDVYKGTDYTGNNKAILRLTNSSQNGDSFSYTWSGGVGLSNFPNQVGQSGYPGTALDLDFTNETAGSYNLTFTATGTPDITAQSDTDNSITVQVNDVPSMPVSNHLVNKSLTLSDAYQGESPKLAAGFTDNSQSNPLVAGDDLITTTARRYTSGTIDTNIIDNAYSGQSGTVTAYINGSASGAKEFTTTLNENGTFDKLIVSNQADAHDTISSSTFPSGFYQTFDAKITGALASTYSVGVNDQRIQHSTTGATNYVAVVYDDMTSLPSLDVSGVTITEKTPGALQYHSGVPYYYPSSGTDAVLTISGLKVSNLTGQTYRDTFMPIQIYKGSSIETDVSDPTKLGRAIENTVYSYAEIEGATTMLTAGIPNANIGVSAPYVIGDLDITVDGYGKEIHYIGPVAYNVNGTSGQVDITSTAVQIYEGPAYQINEENIIVDSSLGAWNMGNGTRVYGFGAGTDTPSYSSSIDYYTDQPWTGAITVAGTQEAIYRWGTIGHNTIDYSTGFLPVGPDLNTGRSGRQYFTFAFKRTVVANFSLIIESTTGIAGAWIAAPGTSIDSSSGLNGWLDTTIQYAGSGVPGSNTGSGGNGSNGCALTGADVIPTGSAISSGYYKLTLGSENMSNATGNVVLVRIGLDGYQTLSSVSIGEVS